MIVSIEGKPGDGKSSFAKKIMHNFKHIYLYGWQINKPFWTRLINESIDWIIVDDVKNMDEAKTLFRSEYLEIEKRGEYPYFIPMPNVILIK